MQNVSATYKALLDAGARREVRAVIAGETYGEDRLVSVGTYPRLFDGDVSVGNCVSTEANIVLRNPGAIPRMAKVEVYLRLVGAAKVLTYAGKRFYETYMNFVRVRGWKYLTLPDVGTISVRFPSDAPSTLYTTQIIAVTAKLKTDGSGAKIDSCIVTASIGNYEFTSTGDFQQGTAEDATNLFRGEVDVTLTDEQDSPVYSEWLPKGVFYIDERSYDKEIDRLTLTCYDAMLKTEQSFCTPGGQGQWPRTDIAMVDEICERIGVALDGRTRAILTKGYLIQYPGITLEDGTPQYDKDGALSMREVLGCIGSMYAGNWVMSDAGELRLVALGDIPAETSLLAEQHGDYILIGGVRIRV